ncbi:hypothetical protein GCM10010402_01990 [Actinomadura luteofluorescens]|uniref:hypothetical protein n=1 Tax=Actinomadura luteofluorescens TaxID=46163 RepID=UPI002164A6C8|nr:hypothetical protein [Actinomadura glauciflava]
MLGSEAAVTETVSPSQLIPSDVHRMWISSVNGCAGAALVIASPLDRLKVITHAVALRERRETPPEKPLKPFPRFGKHTV